MRVQNWSYTGQMDVLGNGGIRDSLRQKLRPSPSQGVADGDKSEQVVAERGDGREGWRAVTRHCQ